MEEAAIVILDGKSEEDPIRDDLLVSHDATTTEIFVTEQKATNKRLHRPTATPVKGSTSTATDLGTDDLVDSSVLRSNRKQYRCDHCDKLFPNPSGLKQHSVVHSEEKIIQMQSM